MMYAPNFVVLVEIGAKPNWIYTSGPTITTSGYTELGHQHVKSHASKKGTMVALWHCARLYE